MTKEHLESILTEYGVAFTDSLADRLLKEFEPSNDMVSRGVFEQVMWERDVATEQLKELGYELGSKVEPCEDADVKLIHTQGLDEGIRCAMCTNLMANHRGCDGACVVNEIMYKKVLDVIRKQIVDKGEL